MGGDTVMIHPVQFRDLIIRPTLKLMGERFEGEKAEMLLLFTAYIESSLSYLKQLNGPALGVYQMESSTHDWLVEIARGRLRTEAYRYIQPISSDRLIYDLLYATIFARLRYYVVPQPLPDVEDYNLATYWKRHYNTSLGKGDVNEAMRRWKALKKIYPSVFEQM